MKVIAVDFDNTLTKEVDKFQIPNKVVIERIKSLYDKNNIIIIHTSRKWEDARFVVGWLNDNGIRWHGLRMEKLKADVYLDDKNILIGDIIDG